MSAYVQESPKMEKAGKQGRNTGFVEPLSEDRNTTLPHPSANLSPNAFLESDDIPLSRTSSRTRRSFLSHRSKSSKGSLITDPKDMYSNIEYADGSKETQSLAELSSPLNPIEDDKAAASGEEDPSRGRDSGVAMGEGEKRDEQGYREGERRNGVLRKLKLHRV